MSLRLAVTLGIVVGFGAIGLLAYQTDRAATSMLVVEGVVVQRESRTNEFQRPNGSTGTVMYTLYQVEVSEFWRLNRSLAIDTHGLSQLSIVDLWTPQLGADMSMLSVPLSLVSRVYSMQL